MQRPPLLVRATSTPSAVGLVAANLVPLVGVLFFGWSLFGVIAVYWIENAVIGSYALLRILTAQGSEGTGQQTPKAFLAPFFVVHYGGFWLGHGVFLVSLFGETGGGDWVEGGGLGVASVVALVVSHGMSFAFNYLAGGERKAAVPSLEMFRPYGRVVVLHLAILGGGFLVDALGAPTLALALFVALKTALDLGIHLLAHGRRYGQLAVSVPDAPGATIRLAEPPPNLRR